MATYIIKQTGAQVVAEIQANLRNAACVAHTAFKARVQGIEEAKEIRIRRERLATDALVRQDVQPAERSLTETTGSGAHTKADPFGLEPEFTKPVFNKDEKRDYVLGGIAAFNTVATAEDWRDAYWDLGTDVQRQAISMAGAWQTEQIQKAINKGCYYNDLRSHLDKAVDEDYINFMFLFSSINSVRGESRPIPAVFEQRIKPTTEAVSLPVPSGGRNPESILCDEETLMQLEGAYARSLDPDYEGDMDPAELYEQLETFYARAHQSKTVDRELPPQEHNFETSSEIEEWVYAQEPFAGIDYMSLCAMNWFWDQNAEAIAEKLEHQLSDYQWELLKTAPKDWNGEAQFKAREIAKLQGVDIKARKGGYVPVGGQKPKYIPKAKRIAEMQSWDERCTKHVKQLGILTYGPMAKQAHPLAVMGAAGWAKKTLAKDVYRSLQFANTAIGYLNGLIDQKGTIFGRRGNEDFATEENKYCGTEVEILEYMSLCGYETEMPLRAWKEQLSMLTAQKLNDILESVLDAKQRAIADLEAFCTLLDGAFQEMTSRRGWPCLPFCYEKLDGEMNFREIFEPVEAAQVWRRTSEEFKRRMLKDRLYAMPADPRKDPRKSK